MFSEISCRQLFCVCERSRESRTYMIQLESRFLPSISFFHNFFLLRFVQNNTPQFRLDFIRTHACTHALTHAHTHTNTDNYSTINCLSSSSLISSSFFSIHLLCSLNCYEDNECRNRCICYSSSFSVFY